MSTIRVNSIKNTNTTDGGISIDGSGHVSIEGQSLPSAGPLTNRNLMINGAMQVAQRGTSFTGLTSGDNYGADRYAFIISGAGTWTVENSTTSLDAFKDSIKIDCTTAKASLGANDQCNFRYNFEGQDLQHLKKGTSAAESLTLSFWVQSNKTGTYIVELFDSDNTRHISRSYTIDSSGTWEKKTITFPGDTTGSLDNDNGNSLTVRWWLAVGTDWSSGTLATSWQAQDNTDRAVGQVNLADSTANEWQITGVQLEVGSVATPFEHRSYGDELARCQRYYYKISYGTDITSFGAGFNQTNQHTRNMICFPVTMRRSPSALEQSGTASDYGAYVLTTTNTCAVVPVFTNASTHGAEVQLQMSSGAFTAGQGTIGVFRTSDAFLAWSAEL
jgi:hypothetical protein